MEDFLNSIKITVNPKIYLKDPETSELGRKIISESIYLITSLGFEKFTFKKIAVKINSTEASIYRYFENKQMLLLYLTSWYWGWVEYRIVFETANISKPETRLKKAISILTEGVVEDSNFSHINEKLLHQIVINDSSKAFLNCNVDEINKEGVFAKYKKLVARISDIVNEINPSYKYPHMLISTVIEGAHLQRYFADHLPKLTDCIEGEDSVSMFYQELVFKSIEK